MKNFLSKAKNYEVEQNMRENEGNDLISKKYSLWAQGFFFFLKKEINKYFPHIGTIFFLFTFH